MAARVTGGTVVAGVTTSPFGDDRRRARDLHSEFGDGWRRKRITLCGASADPFDRGVAQYAG